MSAVLPDGPWDESVSLRELLLPLAKAWRWIIGISILIGAVVYGGTYLIRPTFTARTVFLPPQQQQSAAASALAQLGALSGLAGATAGVRNSADQYVALLQSNAVLDKIVDSFDLMALYERSFRSDARKDLEKNLSATVGKRDGLITVMVNDEDPKRAAAMANQFVDELRQLSNRLALSEAQQRRAFFENQLQATRDRLTQAQIALQASGFTTGALRAEPKAAAEGYARLRAEVTSAEVRLSTLRNSMTEETPEVRSQQATLSALRGQVAGLEANSNAAAAGTPGADYVGKYREFKYQETLFDLFSRQYEVARLDEAREGSLIQVVDIAQPPDKRSRPKRLLTALGALMACLVVLTGGVLVRSWWRSPVNDPAAADGAAGPRRALRRG